MSLAMQMYGTLFTGWGDAAEILKTVFAGEGIRLFAIMTSMPILYMMRHTPEESDDAPAFSTMLFGYGAFIYTVVVLCMNVYTGSDNAFIYFRF